MVAMEKRTYFETPTQVAFKEGLDMTDEPRWIGGIAYRDEIICCECGAVVSTDDVEQIIELPWVSVSEEIIGDAGENF